MNSVVFLIMLFCEVNSLDKVRLQDVQTLSFHKDEYTTGRRSRPLRQIQCDSGCYDYTPDTVQCYNRGSDGFDVNWKCDAELPYGMSFSKVTVGCEGYDYPDDPYILRGSCQVIFSLKGSSGGSYRSKSRSYDYNSYDTSYRSTDNGTSGLSLLGLFLVGSFIYFLYHRYRDQEAGHTVPAYAHAYPNTSYPSSSSSSRTEAGTTHSAYAYPSAGGGGGWGWGGGGWGGGGGQNGMGFWSGMGLGGVLGSLLARRRGHGYGGYNRGGYAGYGGYGGGSTCTSSTSGGGNAGRRSQSGFGGTTRR